MTVNSREKILSARSRFRIAAARLAVFNRLAFKTSPVKTVAIFGGSSGLARQIVPQLKELFDVHALGSREVDVTDARSVKAFFDGKFVDIVLYFSVYNFDGPIHRQPEAEINRQLDVTVRGFLNVLRHATPRMRIARYGRIIFISSILSRTPVAGAGIYSASKAFNDNLIKTYALENSREGITANSIQLGYFDGGLTYKVPAALLKEAVGKIPLNRLGRPEELFNTIRYIVENEFVNGSNLVLAGGA